MGADFSNIGKMLFVNVNRTLTREGYYLLLSLDIDPDKMSQTLVEAPTIEFDMSKGFNATVILTADRIMGLPTNIPAGGLIALRVIQDAIGGHHLTWNAAFKWPGGVAPVLTVAANAVDVITGIIFDGATFQCSAVLNEK